MLVRLYFDTECFWTSITSLIVLYLLLTPLIACCILILTVLN
jgi:hypothetical protein